MASMIQHLPGVLRLFCLVAGGGVVLAAALGWFGEYAWFLDMFSHFQLQYLFALLILIPCTVIARYYWVSALLGSLALFLGYLLLPFYLGGQETPHPSRPTYRIMLSNVYTANTNYQAVIAVIRQFDPDMVVLEEVSHTWMQHLAPLWPTYPYVTAAPQEDNFGIAFLSKVKPVKARIVNWGKAYVPSTVVTLDLPGGRITVLGTHPVPPIGQRGWLLRNEQLTVLSELIPTVPIPFILLGDLNMSPWSYYFRDFLRRTHLQDCSKGQGVQATWPTFQPLLLIPLDHCLHSSHIKIIDKQVGPDVGSDHYPIIVDFQLPLFPAP